MASYDCLWEKGETLKGIVSKFLFVIFGAVLLWLLYWRFKLGLTRYFNMDEFLYLKYAAMTASGSRPYIDFFTFLPPLFTWVLVPIFWVTNGISAILAGRIVAFVIFLFLLSGVGSLFWELRRSKLFALVAMVLLTFLPMPLDKFIEIRPDILAMACAVWAVFFQIKWMKGQNRRHGFISAILWSVSLLVLPKTAPSVAVGLFVLGGYFLSRKDIRGDIRIWVAGLMFPFLLFALWILLRNNLSIALYSVIKLPFEVTKFGGENYMPDLFFNVNNTYYGCSGMCPAFVANHILWIVGSLFGIYRLFTPFLPDGKRGAWIEVLVWGFWIIQAAVFVLYIPMKHAQYLIPVAIGIALACADALYCLDEYLQSKKGGYIISFICMALLGLYGGWIGGQTIQTRLTYVDMNQRAAVAYLSQLPKNTNVFDLIGYSLSLPHPYPVCCLHFGQFSGYLSRPLPSLQDVLEAHSVQYVAGVSRLDTLTIPDQQYIASHFDPVPGVSEILVRKKE